jgi:hypothetical protein
MLAEGRGNVGEAVNNYEQTLSFDQRSIGAAIGLNNLAWLCANKGKGNTDCEVVMPDSALSLLVSASGIRGIFKKAINISASRSNHILSSLLISAFVLLA